MNIHSLKATLSSPRFRKVRKPLVIVVGGTVLLAGVVLVFIPGPALIVIPAGLAILSLEFDWARRWMQRLSQLVRRFKPRRRRETKPPSPPRVG